MRPTFFAITLLFSIYYAYDAYRDEYPWIQKNEINGFRKFWNWDQKDLILEILAYSHMGLGAALCIREWINSPAVDALEPLRLPFADNVSVLHVLSVICSGLRDFVIITLSVWWQLSLCGFSVLGFFVSPHWYAPALLDIIPQIRLMSFLIEAITRNTSRIFYTLLLAIVLLYLYSVITIVFFKNQYGLAGHFACNDLISCFKLQIDYGLVNPPEWIGEGYIDPFIGTDFKEHETYGYVSSILMGTTFNFTYIILINLVLQAIISGLIIDTFGEMRAESEAIEDDIKEKCFMCNIDRDQFEHSGIPFQEHVKSEHNMWHYVWFSIYIESKDPLTYTGPEQYVFENMTDKNGFVRLGPIKKSLSISRKSGKVKEEFTLKGVYDSLSKITKFQQHLMTTTQTLSTGQSKTAELCASQDKKISELTSIIKDTGSAVNAVVPSVASMKDEIMSIMAEMSKTSGQREDADETESMTSSTAPSGKKFFKK
ncbi:Itpr2 [Symbiodinium microadriaticum]|nr:Itpr2 [Symbiodinium microadriaticum]